MTARAALCEALLKGRVVTIMTGFHEFGITNVPREISRAVEDKFKVEVSRVQKEGISSRGYYCTWHEYHLNRTDYNKPGIEKMKAYVKEQIKTRPAARTTQEQKKFTQQELFLAS